MNPYAPSSGSSPGRSTEASSVPRDSYAGLQSTDRAPREAIQHRAYALWQNEGEPSHRDVAHWLQAEVEVMHGS